MTRFRIGIIDKFGNLNYSNEFNGDGYWEGHGKEVYKALGRVKNVKGLYKLTCKINKKYFGYEDEFVGVNMSDVELEFVDDDDYIHKFGSDYLYIKNCGDEIRVIRGCDRAVALRPGKRMVICFGDVLKVEG